MFKDLARGQGKGGKERQEISMSGDSESRGAPRVKGNETVRGNLGRGEISQEGGTYPF